MPLSRRSFLRLAGLGAAAGGVALVAPEPIRRWWQVSAGAPVKGLDVNGVDPWCLVDNPKLRWMLDSAVREQMIDSAQAGIRDWEARYPTPPAEQLEPGDRTWLGKMQSHLRRPPGATEITVARFVGAPGEIPRIEYEMQFIDPGRRVLLKQEAFTLPEFHTVEVERSVEHLDFAEPTGPDFRLHFL